MNLDSGSQNYDVIVDTMKLVTQYKLECSVEHKPCALNELALKALLYLILVRGIQILFLV